VGSELVWTAGCRKSNPPLGIDAWTVKPIVCLFFCSNNTFSTNHALKFEYQPVCLRVTDQFIPTVHMS
jgi:hypothetical protein